MDVLLIGVYAVAMWYGVLSMGLAYLFDETRRIPPLQFLAGAVLLPGGAAFGIPLVLLAAGKGLTTLASPATLVFFLALPAVLAFLFLRAWGAEAHGAESLRRRWTQAHADADAALAVDPNDMFALLHKAKYFEEEGRYEDALAAYERTHSISEKMLPVYTLDDHRRRLRLFAEKRDADAARKTRWSSWLAAARVESVLLGLGLLLSVFAWPLALQLSAFMLFVRWFHSEAPKP